MTHTPRNSTDQQEIWQRQLRHARGMLRIYRWALALSLLMNGVLLLLLFFAKIPQQGRAIYINGEQVAIVRHEQAAAAVRKRLLAQAAGQGTGATFKERWEEATIPTRGEPVLSVSEAVQKLKNKVTVLQEAYAIEANEQQLVIVPTREMAQAVLDRLQGRYAAPSDAVVRLTKLVPKPKIRPCAVPPEHIVRDEQKAVEAIQQARREAVYIVQPGDYPEQIAAKHQMSLEEFWRLNPHLRGKALRAGQPAKVLQASGGLKVVTIKEMATIEAIPPPVQKQFTGELPKGAQKVVQPGRAGYKRVRWEITMYNEREVTRRRLSEETVQAPHPQIVLIGRK